MFTMPVGMLRKKGPGVSPLVPTFVSSSSNILGSGNNPFTINAPSSLLTDDLLLFIYWGRDNVSQITGQPGGWTQDFFLTPTLDGANQYFYVYHKFAAGEPGSYNWSLNGGAGVKGATILAYRGVNTATPFDVQFNAGTIAVNSGTHTISSQTTVNVDERVIVAYAMNRSGTSNLNLSTGPSGMTQRFFSNFSTASAADLGIAVYDTPQETAGSTGAKTLTTASADVSSVGVMMSLQSAGA
jgi:hypothetical protein